ncbi:MAG: double-strand break repair helicase AddA [Rhodospirillales bacterium]|nr:double-strand break repair helicase AddA [Rhodospirillales bacterium]
MERALFAAERAGPADDPNEWQRGASDPGACVWVAASAGTGKTKVLTDRVLRLMLDGNEPRRILCLTYTKAAAAEMANRIAQRLGIWAVAQPADLHCLLIELLGSVPTAHQLLRARQLFARVLDSPGGINIQTIHAFCQSLLGRFPLEARVPPHFTVLDERDAKALLAEARHEVMAAAERGADALAAALAVLTGYLREGAFDELMDEIARPPDRLTPLIEAFGSAAAAGDAARAVLGLAAGDTCASVLDDACVDTAFDIDALRAAAGTLAGGTAAESNRAAAIAAWLAASPNERALALSAYIGAFLTGEGTIRAAKNLVTKGTEAAHPGTLEAVLTEAGRLHRLVQRQRAIVVAEATQALIVVGDALLRSYRRLKEAAAQLDYGDLIAGAGRLLADGSDAAWVLFKLDGGIDHLLIDEAQDTAPDQWRVITGLTQEFFAGAGGRDVARTIFAVGDVKQSIFSFQGADPAAFLLSRDWYAARVKAADRRWRPIPLQTSFRSTRAVLLAVDATFKDAEMAQSIALEPQVIVHQAFRLRDGGSVELWPSIAAREPAASPAWAPPIGRESADSPPDRLAALIALRIAAMLDDGEMLHAYGRPIRPGDVMVLVRRRGSFMQALVRALKERQIAVAGVDRMLLSEQLAVMDLMALGRFVLLPDDDLTLASVLKGPLLGFDEEALFALAWNRPGSLWRALRWRAETDEPCRFAYRFLRAQLAFADVLPPFAFFNRALGPLPDGEDATDSGRRRLLSRLGREAEDPIAEFLELCLAYERHHAPSLQGFLHWLEAGDVEIKRDPEQGQQNAVRVMTVHGAKGLQAPIVFLPDSCQTPTPKDKLLWIVGDRTGKTMHPEVLLWPPRGELREAVCDEAHGLVARRQTEEYRRLLYVAMTRASDRLIVCGWLNRKQKDGPAAGSWYEAIQRGLTDAPGSEWIEDAFLSRHAGPGGLIESPQALRLTCAQEAALEPHVASEPAPPPPLPDWATQRAPDEQPALRPLRPSLGDDAPPATSPLAAGDRFRRGRIVHRLLQALPELPAEERADAARHWLARPVHDLDPVAQQELTGEVMAVLNDRRFSALFGPASRAEVPVSGEIGGRIIAGQIDRLVVENDGVTILDYKSDRPAPTAPHGVAPAYLRQMAAYRALLQQLYPNRPVRCLLLWTQEPRPMLLEDELLDRWTPGAVISEATDDDH